MQQCDTTMYIPKLRLGSLVVLGSIGYTTTSSCASSLFYAKKAQQHCQILGCGATLAATQMSDGTYFRVLVFRLGINRSFSCGNGTKDENYFKAGLRCDGTSPYTHPHLGRCGSLRLCLAPQAATPCTTPPTHRSIPLLDRSRLARRSGFYPPSTPQTPYGNLRPKRTTKSICHFPDALARLRRICSIFRLCLAQQAGTPCTIFCNTLVDPHVR